MDVFHNGAAGVIQEPPASYLATVILTELTVRLASLLSETSERYSTELLLTNTSP